MNLKRFIRSLRLFFSIIAIVYYTTKSALLLPLDTRPYKTNRIRVARANLALEKARYHALTVAWLTEPTIEKNRRHRGLYEAAQAVLTLPITTV